MTAVGVDHDGVGPIVWPVDVGEDLVWGLAAVVRAPGPGFVAGPKAVPVERRTVAVPVVLTAMASAQAVAGDVGEVGAVVPVVGVGGPGLVRREGGSGGAADGDAGVVDRDGVGSPVTGDVGQLRAVAPVVRATGPGLVAGGGARWSAGR